MAFVEQLNGDTLMHVAPSHCVVHVLAESDVRLFKITRASLWRQADFTYAIFVAGISLDSCSFRKPWVQQRCRNARANYYNVACAENAGVPEREFSVSVGRESCLSSTLNSPHLRGNVTINPPTEYRLIVHEPGSTIQFAPNMRGLMISKRSIFLSGRTP